MGRGKALWMLIVIPAAFCLAFGIAGGAPVSLAQKSIRYEFYFPWPTHSALGVDTRQVDNRGTLIERVRRVMDILTAGPESDKLAPAFPPDRHLRQLFVDRSGTAFVDLERPPDLAGGVGVMEERLFIWSMVNTLCLNFPDIHTVKILVGGDEAPTLFGHIDITHPLLPDRGLIFESP